MGRGRELELPFVSKAPFANYDLVVYFGGGLFATLIFWKYIALPLHIFDFSTVASGAPHWWVQDVVDLLVLAVCAYVLGHLVSYQSSYFIEGFIERTLGKFSNIVELTTITPSDRSKTLKKKILANTKKELFLSVKIPSATNRILVPRIFPTIVHLPVLPWYCIVLICNFFEFADTRLPARMVTHLKRKIIRCFPEMGDENGRQWFRWVEYHTAYNKPVAAASMYNYLVISGFMRSLAYLFLIAIWLELAHLGIRLRLGYTMVSHGHGGVLGWALYFFVLYTAYITTVTSYCKFFRRYVEEAIMGFLLEGPASVEVTADCRKCNLPS
jgi:hypothetical protein